MAKSKNVNKKSNKKTSVNAKNTKKTVNKKIDLLETSTSKEVLKVLRILLIVIVVLSAFYLLTVAIVNNDDEDDEIIETAIQYDEILAGSSFNMKDDEYLVVYYDYSDTELTELTSQLSSYTYTGQYRLYIVDMSNGFNKPYVSEEKSNTKPESAEELLISGPTLIKISDGKVEAYIEGTENIIEYLK